MPEPFFNHSHSRLCVALILCMAPSVVDAHGTGIFVSTPFAPPLRWEWIIPLYVGLQVLWWRKLARRWNLAGFHGRFGWHLFGSMAIAFLAGMFFTGLNTAPPPGFGLFGQAFYGYGWSVWPLFVIGNGFGVLVLTWFLYRLLRRFDFVPIRVKLKYASGAVLIYVVSLIPLMAAGALSHGWFGGYVDSACRYKMEEVGRAIYRYSLEHGDRLPDSLESPDMTAQIAAIQMSAFFGDPLICREEETLHSHPQKCSLNPKIAGMKLEVLKQMDPATEMIVCPRPDHRRLSVQRFLEYCAKKREE